MESNSIQATRSDGTLIEGVTLRACPFCSGEAEIIASVGGDHVAHHVATCSDCGSQGPTSNSDVEACAAWNSPGDYPRLD